jgi:hypothetical protein
MRSVVNTTTVVTAVGVFLISGSPGQAQEATPISPELKPLQRFIGSWDQQVVSKPTIWTPKETTAKCPVTVNWILRGRMIEHRCAWSPGNTQGLCLMAYDAVNGQYRQWYFDSSGSIPHGENRGKWDEAAKTFTWKGASDNAITSTQTHRFFDSDTQEWTLVFKDRTGKVLLDMEAKAKRKPLVTSSDSQGQGAKAPPPEMKLLRQMIGTWKESNVSRVAEWTPEETRGQSTLKVVPILGGHFVRCEVFDDDGKAIAMMIRTFDAEQQACRQWMFHPGSCGVEARGQWDDATNTLTLTDEGQRITSVATMWFSDKDTMQWSFISRDRQGKVYFDAIGKSVRQR